MALDVDVLLNEIDADLGVAVSASTQNSQAVDDLYEAFLLGLVLRAARAIDPAAVGWQNLTGANNDEVRLRGGPGEIYSTQFSFATLTFGGDVVFELGAVSRSARAWPAVVYAAPPGVAHGDAWVSGRRRTHRFS